MKKYQWNETDFKALKAAHPDITGWEVNSDYLEQYLKDTEHEDLQEFKELLKKTGFDWFAIAAPSGSFGSNTEPAHAGDEEYLKGFERDNDFRLGFGEEWIENAAAVGVKLMRIDFAPYFMNHKVPYTYALDWNINRNVETYKQLCAIGKDHGVEIGIENHGGFASDPLVLRKLFKEVPDLKLTFDTGNVRDEWRYSMLEEFIDRVHYVHAKAHVFNEDGEESNIDFGKIIGMLKDNGYDGWLSIEWEGPLGGDEGVKKTADVLKKYL